MSNYIWHLIGCFGLGYIGGDVINHLMYAYKVKAINRYLDREKIKNDN